MDTGELVEAWRGMLAGVGGAWVLFENGTCVTLAAPGADPQFGRNSRQRPTLVNSAGFEPFAQRLPRRQSAPRRRSVLQGRLGGTCPARGAREGQLCPDRATIDRTLPICGATLHRTLIPRPPT